MNMSVNMNANIPSNHPLTLSIPTATLSTVPSKIQIPPMSSIRSGVPGSSISSVRPISAIASTYPTNYPASAITSMTAIPNSGTGITSVVQGVDWNSVKSLAPAKKTNAKRDRIHHEIFEQCLPFLKEDDPFWIDIFTNAIRDKFPKGFNYRNGTLNYIKKGKITSINVDNNPEQAVIACINFFKNHGGLRSEFDLQEEQAHYVNSQACTNTRSKSAKNVFVDVMIPDFILRVQKALNFNRKAINHLTTILNLGIITGDLRMEDCFINNGQIEQIGPLLIEPNPSNEYGYNIQLNSNRPPSQRSSRTKAQPCTPGRELSFIHRTENIFFKQWSKVMSDSKSDDRSSDRVSEKRSERE